MKPAATLLLLACLLVLAGCEREERHFSAEIVNASQGATGVRRSTNQPAMALSGNVREPQANISMYDDNAFDINQGKRLFHAYNCSGCHANGGGSIGPSLMDSQWIYGSDPKSLFETIMQGRPNGMPSFGGHIPEDQVWKIVAYVRSIGGGVRSDVAPSRPDSLYPGKPENFRSPQPAIQKGNSKAEQSMEPAR
jgi:cytochrome c oxidase cbb3-type subunit III